MEFREGLLLKVPMVDVPLASDHVIKVPDHVIKDLGPWFKEVLSPSPLYDPTLSLIHLTSLFNSWGSPIAVMNNRTQLWLGGDAHMLYGC